MKFVFFFPLLTTIQETSKIQVFFFNENTFLCQSCPMIKIFSISKNACRINSIHRFGTLSQWPTYNILKVQWHEGIHFSLRYADHVTLNWLYSDGILSLKAIRNSLGFSTLALLTFVTVYFLFFNYGGLMWNVGYSTVFLGFMPWIPQLWQPKCLYYASPLRFWLCNPKDRSPPGSSVRGDSPGKSTGVGYHALL